MFVWFSTADGIPEQFGFFAFPHAFDWPFGRIQAPVDHVAEQFDLTGQRPTTDPEEYAAPVAVFVRHVERYGQGGTEFGIQQRAVAVDLDSSGIDGAAVGAQLVQSGPVLESGEKAQVASTLADDEPLFEMR
ncbi:conserved hypothetical protein [Trichinella spiralis]|uniref:hypothetical protein n=1 Tax=Trichinella spiralis TaxID=6334 RepID=UPI0001EFB5BF|nr:conserved hypothetical protein [Trichinella spiralis]